MKAKKRPWTDVNGKLLSDDELKIVSKKWGKQAWEDYLSENVDVKLKERNISDPQLIESYSNDEHSKFFSNGFDPSTNPYLKEMVRELVDTLPKNEKRVIRKIYWENKTLREIAREMGHHHSAIGKWHQNALLKLKSKILSIIVELGNKK